MQTLKTLVLTCVGVLLTFNPGLQGNANSISTEQLRADLNYLAADQLAGRANFSEHIDEAANYIGKRFSNIGLSPIAGDDSYLNTFTVFGLSVGNIKVSVDQVEIANNDIIVLGNSRHIGWSQTNKIDTLTITADDNFHKKLALINQHKQDLLVLVDKAHAPIFARYRNHFNRARHYFELDQGPAAVMILSESLAPESYQIEITNLAEKKSLSNVIGVLPGKAKKNEVVVFSAHYDHLGQSQSQGAKSKKDIIFNGADDNASGVAAVINLAEHFKRKDINERTLIFTAFSGEEIGGFGSKHFSSSIQPKDIVAMINIEMIGKPSKFGAGEFWMTGYEKSDLGKILNTNLARWQKKLHADPYPKFQLFYRSDNATLARLGVPAHSFSSSQIDEDPHYHKFSDEIQTLDLNSMTKVVQSLALAVESVVNGSDKPARIKIEEIESKGSFF